MSIRLPPSLLPLFFVPLLAFGQGNGIWNGNSSSGSGIQYYPFRALNANTVAASNFSIPATAGIPSSTNTNAPMAFSIEGANSGDPTSAATAWNYGGLVFFPNATAATAPSVQGQIPLLPTWTSSAGIKVYVRQNTSGVVSGTYTSGGSVTGTSTQTCIVTFAGSGGGTATVALTGTNAIAGGTALVVTNAGYYNPSTTAPASAVLTSGTATCSGTIVVATSTGAPSGNVLWQLQGYCVANGATDASFGTASPFTATAGATTDTDIVLTLTTSDVLSGCAAPSAGAIALFAFRLFRDHQNVADTLAGGALLKDVVFAVQQ